jgi:hypothetical protein
MAKAPKSAFVATLSAKKNELIKAAQSQRAGGITESSEIVEAYGLDEGSRITVKCKLLGVKVSCHEEGANKGLPYVSFSYAPVEAPGKGMTFVMYLPGYDRKTKEVTEKAMTWIFQEFQGFGFDTRDWGADPSQIETAGAELNKEKPTCMVNLRCSKIQAGARAGELVVNFGINRIVETDAPAPKTLSQELDEVMEAPAAKVAETPAPRKPAAKKAAAFKVGDKVIFTFTDEDNNEEEVEGEITGLEGDTYQVTDGTYSYDLTAAEMKKA